MTKQNMAILEQKLSSPLPFKKGTKLVTEELLSALPFNQEYKPSIHWLDNKNLVFGNENSIELIDIQSHHRSILTHGIHPKPSPDGQWIAFIKQVDNKNQLFCISIDGKFLKQLTLSEEGLTGYFDYHFGYIWSACSKYLVLHYQPYIPHWERGVKKEEDKLKSSATIIEEKLKTPPKSQINSIDIHTGDLKILLTIDDSIRSLSWGARGEELIFMSDRYGRNYNQKNDKTWIYSFNVKNKKLLTLLELDGLQQFLSPVSSHDGKYVAFTYDADNRLFNFMTSIGVITTDNVACKNEESVSRLTHDMKLFFPQWSKDNTSLFALRDYGAYRQLYHIQLDKKAIHCLTDSPLNIENFVISPDGSKLAWVGQDAHSKIIIKISSYTGKEQSEIAVISEVIDDLALSEIKEIEWSIPNYPQKMRGLVVLPINHNPANRYPLIVDIHGGGPGAHIYLKGAILVNSPLEWQLWAAKGYVVFVPEFRSSFSFGSFDIAKAMPDLVNQDIADILAGVDHLVEQGIVDNERMVAIGHSAGARRVNWLLVSTNRFKAIVSKEGWADEWLMSGTEERDLIYSVYGGHPALVPENYQKNSSLFHAKNASTPTLFLMGEAKMGGVDRYGTVRWLYYAMKALGIKAEYIYYPDEGHNFKRLANQKDALQRAVCWIAHYLEK